MNILDDLNMGVSDDEIREAATQEDFEQQGVVSVSPDDKYLEFDSLQIVKRIRPYQQKKAVSRDIITRSLYIKSTNDEAELLATDAVSYLSTKLSVKNNNFPKEVIIDTESFAVVARTHKAKTHLLDRDSKMYSKFYGGEIFIPSYRLNTEVYTAQFGEVIESGEINPIEFRNALYSLSPIVSSSNVPELGYIFFEGNQAYASNGVVIASVDCVSPKCVIRLSDVTLLLDVLDSVEDTIFHVEESESLYRMKSKSFCYSFPKLDVKLSESYKNLFERTKGKYFINFPYLASILEVLTKLPEFSGVVEIESKDNKMKGVAKTKKGDVSDFEISSSYEGEMEEGGFGVSMKALKVSLRVFKGEASIASFFANGKLMYESGNKRCVIVLKK